MFFRELARILLIALSIAALSAAGATATTGDGVAIDMDRSSSESLETLDELRALDHQVAALFRTGGRKLPRQCRIVVSDALPKGELQAEFKPQEWILAFNDRDGDWLEDFALRRRLTGLLLLAKIPRAEPPADPDYLPGWISAGIDARLKGARQSESLMRRNRRLPVLRALLESGNFPEFRKLRLLDPRLLPSAALAWYGELGRVMLELGYTRSNAADNALLDYCILSAHPAGVENQNFQSTLGRVFLAGALREALPERIGAETWAKLDDDGKIERILQDHARRLAFNDFLPQPVPLAAAAFATLNQVPIPELGANAAPTGKTLEAPLAEFPQRILDRPDAAELQRALRQKILLLREGNDIGFRQLLDNLADAAMRLPLRKDAASGETPAPDARFRQAIDRIRADLERRARIERFLDAVELENRIPAEFYADAIREANRPSSALTGRELEFLNRVEREWLDD